MKGRKPFFLFWKLLSLGSFCLLAFRFWLLTLTGIFLKSDTGLPGQSQFIFPTRYFWSEIYLQFLLTGISYDEVKEGG